MAAIYQKARPYTFAQVVGQEHVKDVLLAALKKDRIGHAYLFSGPRGVGKTTMARLLAMAVNCEGDTPPCGECSSCQLVRQGSHPDIIELDAASNNSVDDIRDLREKVNLASIQGGIRVWILDEAHMLTKSAANALLKTLEEPPSKLMFILATTEPEKLPPTVLSRCQHYRFRRLSEAEITRKLTHLCQQANVEAEEEALKLVARAADGAMRDAESLLERLLTPEEAISKDDAEKALGLPPQDRLQALAKHLVKGDLEALFKETTLLYNDGFAPRSLCERLKLTLRDALYGQLGLVGHTFKLEVKQESLLRLIHALDDEAERFIRYDDLFSLEVALIKGINALKNNLPQASAPAIDNKASTAKTPLPNFNPTARRQPQSQPQPRKKIQEPPQTAASPEKNWNNFMRQVSSVIKAFLIPASVKVDGNNVYLNYPSNYHFHFEQLKGREDEFIGFFTKFFGDGYIIHLVSAKAKHVMRAGKSSASSTIKDESLPEKVQTQSKQKQPIDTPVVESSNKEEPKKLVEDDKIKVASKKTVSELPNNELELSIQNESTKLPIQEEVADADPLEALPPDFWDSRPVDSLESDSAPKVKTSEKKLPLAKGVDRVLELFPGEVSFTPNPKDKSDKN